MHTIPAIDELYTRGALFVINHSGGKDSQAMLLGMAAAGLLENAIVVHADLGEVEWGGAREIAEADAERLGLPFIVAQAGKTFFEMVERRFEKRPDVPSWPSASSRQCTSDLKRDPIAKVVRRYADEHGYTEIVNCTGIRAEESTARAKKETFRVNNRETNGKRDWYEWLPIHAWSTEAVWDTIDDAGVDSHPAYAAGNERLSCVFCIMASQNDLVNGARHRPELAKRYIELEEKTGYTMHMSRRPLRELIADAAIF